MPDVTSGLRIDPALRSFVATSCCRASTSTPDRFWATLADLHEPVRGPRSPSCSPAATSCRTGSTPGTASTGAGRRRDAYAAFLTEIGYLLPRSEPRICASPAWTAEIAEVRGPAAGRARHRARATR